MKIGTGKTGKLFFNEVYDIQTLLAVFSLALTTYRISRIIMTTKCPSTRRVSTDTTCKARLFLHLKIMARIIFMRHIFARHFFFIFSHTKMSKTHPLSQMAGSSLFMQPRQYSVVSEVRHTVVTLSARR